MGKQPAEDEKGTDKDGDKEQEKGKPKAEKAAKPDKPVPPGDAQAKPKKAKPAAEAGTEQEPQKAKEKQKDKGKDKDKEKDKAKEEKAKPAPRPPADPRLKVLKKFYGKFLPRGPLRDRHMALMDRWNSGEDHGGVTLEELKSLHADWTAARAKQAGMAGTSR